MLTHPTLAMKQLADVKPGELFRATVHVEHGIGLRTSNPSQDGDEQLCAWLALGEDAEPTLRYAPMDMYCLSYGLDWVIAPDHRSPKLAGRVSGPVALHATAGWMFRVKHSQSSFGWCIMTTGELQQSPSLARMAVFDRFAIYPSQAAVDSGNDPLFKV